MNKIRNKKAWIRIVEAFIAILLIMGVLLIVINKGYIRENEIPLEIYEKELSILRGIELNEMFRSYILQANKTGHDPNSGESPLPIEWDDFTNDPPHEGLDEIKNEIKNEIPDYLDCEAKVCVLSADCILNKNFETQKDIYVQSIAIVANLEIYSPRQLKLFCWEK